jgi:putative transposase
MGQILLWLQERVQLWTKPARPVLAVGLLSDLTRSRTDLLIENALRRQQLIILQRQVKRPPLTAPERFRLVFLAHFTKFWKPALHILQPDTLLRWHPNLFRRAGRRKWPGRPKVASETIILIQKMATENLWW